MIKNKENVLIYAIKAMRITSLRLCLLCALSIITCFIIGSAAYPFMVLLLLFSLAMFFLSLSLAVQNTWMKNICVGLFSLALPLAIFEGYFLITYKPVTITTELPSDTPISASLLQNLDPSESYTRKSSKRILSATEQVFFDTIFTYDSLGRRITPHAPQAKTAVVLLGCSFTFGDGLKDEETFAYKLGLALGEEYQVFNLGKNGYGPHRILHDLERGLAGLEGYSQILFYYFAIEDHLKRISGAAAWDKNGPLYDVRDGKAVLVGNFSELNPFYTAKNIFFWVKRSHLYQKIQPQLQHNINKSLPRNTQEKQLELQGAIMASMKDITTEKYSHSSFSVLLWPPKAASLMKSFLSQIPHYDVEAWFPDYDAKQDLYIISPPHEFHPSAHANAIVAKEMEKIVRQDTARN